MMPKSINVTKKTNKKVLVLSPVIEHFPKYEDHMIMCESKATITWSIKYIKMFTCTCIIKYYVYDIKLSGNHVIRFLCHRHVFFCNMIALLAVWLSFLVDWRTTINKTVNWYLHFGLRWYTSFMRGEISKSGFSLNILVMVAKWRWFKPIKSPIRRTSIPKRNSQLLYFSANRRNQTILSHEYSYIRCLP